MELPGILSFSTGQMLALIFHALACIHHIFIILYSCQLVYGASGNITDRRVLDMFELAPLYFTTWNFLIQTFYYMISFYAACRRLGSTRDETDRYRGYIFTSFVLPFSGLVLTAFWVVFTIDRELVMPSFLDEHIPFWYNHALHTNVLVFPVTEVLILGGPVPTPSFKSAFVGYTTLFLVYHALFFLAFFLSGRWVYRLFYFLNWQERIGFVFSYYIFMVFLHILGIYIQNVRNKNASLNCFKVSNEIKSS